MLKRINPHKIIKDHFNTLRRFDGNNKRISLSDFLIFIVFPFIISTILSIKEYSINSFVGNLLTSVAIFGGFLFNLLAIIYNLIDKIRDDANNENNGIKKLYIKEIHINISYSILLSIFVTIILVFYTIDIQLFTNNYLIQRIALGLIYFLFINFFLTLMMVLNRMYILLKRETE